MTSPATGRGGCHSDSYVVPREDLRAQALRLCKQKAPSSMEAMQAMAAPETGPGECHLDMHCCRGEHRPLNAMTCLLRLPFVMLELDLCHVKLLAGNLYTAATTSLLKRCVRNMGSCHEFMFTSGAVCTRVDY